MEEVHFQTEHLGYQTDDLLVVARAEAGNKRSLLVQVKRAFRVSEKNEECVNAIIDFWTDYRTGAPFDASADRFAILTQFGTDTLLKRFTSLLDTARASISADDFSHRVTTDGYLHSIARKQAASVRKILDKASESPISDDDYWQFLKLMHVISYDLATATSQVEAWIKTLLASTAAQQNAVGGAAATWTALVDLAGRGMGNAVSYTHEKLPADMRHRHQGNLVEMRAAVQALHDHSATIVNSIKTTVAGSYHIPRDTLATRLLENLEESRVLLVTGPAGFGKSVTARGAFELLHNEHLAFAFRAEEFGVAHLDTSLRNAQVNVTAARLFGALAGQGRKLLLVESVERLLEASVRDAFADLLGHIRHDPTWRVILTCRDYSVDIVRSSLFEHANLTHTVFMVPMLSEAELDSATGSIPALASVVGSTVLRPLLRIPYVMDKAASMEWQHDQPIPTNEREFRRKFWREIVRDEAHASIGLPNRREQSMVAISLRRAKSLSLYASCDDLDAEALNRLRNDGLITYEGDGESRAAPSHDVLEDWSSLVWVQQQYTKHEGEASQLALEIGGYPALRRAYRRWLAEIMDCDSTNADALVLAVLDDNTLPAHFRDDTIVSVLRSSSADSYIERNKDALLADGANILRRVIHLLRVACKITPPWLPFGQNLPPLFFVPDGVAWPAVLGVLANHLDLFLPQDASLLLGLVEDWALGVAWWQPHPPGEADAGRIAYAVLSCLDNYQTRELEKCAMKVILKIPAAVPEEFMALMLLGSTDDRSNHRGREFAELLLTGLDGIFAAREYPDAVIELAIKRLCMTDADLSRRQRYSSSNKVESVFGIRDHWHYNFFPASAQRGPFMSLLQWHPEKGVDFILQLMNHACDWYGKEKWSAGRLEPTFRLTLGHGEDGELIQYANSRLWGLYRGLSVGPYVLQTALMALEKWLLELCKSDDSRASVEGWLRKLLRETNNISVTAVAASVCNAAPAHTGCAGLSLLTSRELILMDRARMVGEYQMSSGFGDIFSMHNADSVVYDSERKEANTLPHRQHDLEAVAVKLQLTEYREQVWGIIDRHLKALPPVEEQTDDDRLWRLALHRMDIRKYEAREIDGVPGMSEEQKEVENESTESFDRSTVCYAPSSPDDDIQEMIDKQDIGETRRNTGMSLSIWGSSVWRGDGGNSFDPGAWHDKLSNARNLPNDGTDVGNVFRGGPGFIAAVCIRDHWEDLNEDEREWCLNTLVGEVQKKEDSTNLLGPSSDSELSPSRAAAFILSKALTHELSDTQRRYVRAGIYSGLTHASSEVVNNAAAGIGRFLANVDETFCLHCATCLAKQAMHISAQMKEEQSRPYSERREYRVVEESMSPSTKINLQDINVAHEFDPKDIDLGDWPGKIAAKPIMSILHHLPQHPVAVVMFGLVEKQLVSWWDQRDDHTASRRAERDHYYESDCEQRLASFVLRLATNEAIETLSNIMDAIERHPREVEQFLRALVIAEDRAVDPTCFWGLWQAFADRFKNVSWISSLNVSSYQSQLMHAIFLGKGWKKGVRNWSRMDGNADRVHLLFKDLPLSDISLEAYCRFLNSIGGLSLPSAFKLVAVKIRGTPAIHLTENAAYLLEIMLRRFIYSQPFRLKQERELREAVVCILDCLVDAGSSAAYRMRDDFVTPMTSAGAS